MKGIQRSEGLIPELGIKRWRLKGVAVEPDVLASPLSSLAFGRFKHAAAVAPTAQVLAYPHEFDFERPPQVKPSRPAMMLPSSPRTNTPSGWKSRRPVRITLCSLIWSSRNWTSFELRSLVTIIGPPKGVLPRYSQ